jgi:hypothetical protein
MAKQPKYILVKLREIRRLSNFENADFDERGLSMINKNNTSYIVDRDGKEYTITEYIKETTRLYRDSWINPLIDQLLEQE